MLTVSLHGIRLHAYKGMYPEELVLGNEFEIDVDIWHTDTQPWDFIDYTIIHSTVIETFHNSGHTLETMVADIHAELKIKFPGAGKVRVALRKLHPPMPGMVAFAQVCFEK